MSGNHDGSLYGEVHTPWDWHAELFALGKEFGVNVFSSPFDASAVDLLEDLDCPVYKIASSEIIDLPLIRLAASTGKPVIISTGMATASEIDAAVSAARGAGDGGVVVLSATTSYPAPVEYSNLRALPVLSAAFGCPVGLSDHTPGIGAAAAAVALGGCIVEKHVTVDRDQGGVDAESSLEPAGLADTVIETRRAWAALGEPRLGPRSVEAEGLRFRRSLSRTSRTSRPVMWCRRPTFERFVRLGAWPPMTSPWSSAVCSSGTSRGERP